MTDFFALQIGDAYLRVPEELRPEVSPRIDLVYPYVATLPYTEVDRWAETIPYVFACSGFVAQQCGREPAMLRQLIESKDLLRPYRAGELGRRLAGAVSEAADDADFQGRLRRFRNRELVRIAWRDLSGWADLRETMDGLSALADACLQVTVDFLLARARERIGVPRAEASGPECAFVVLGLGTLGANELGFSSEIDLLFAYDHEGQTVGRRVVTNRDFFTGLTQALISTMATVAAGGVIFSVKVPARPDGERGPLALSFDAAEAECRRDDGALAHDTLTTARAVAGDLQAGLRLLGRLKPAGAYRRHDEDLLARLRTLQAAIERDAGRDGVEGDIELGPGGMREVEFIVQAQQRLCGIGADERQPPDTLTGLARLAAAGHLATAAMLSLTAAYVFLRNVAHRLQVVAGRQTHRLPSDAREQRRLALAMGYAAWHLFSRELARHRRKVRKYFAQSLEGLGAAVDAGPPP